MNLTELRALAEAAFKAVGGTWNYHAGTVETRLGPASWDPIADCCLGDVIDERCRHVGAYIAAANPERILAMITAIEKMRETLKYYAVERPGIEIPLGNGTTTRIPSLGGGPADAINCLSKVDELLK